MRVLYLTNHRNPYRDEFFEQLGRACDLTVAFEQRSDAERDASWFEQPRAQSYKELYLPDSEGGPVSPAMLRLVAGDWSLVVVGCYNSPKQIAAVARMRRRGIPYVVNSDGALFELGGLKAAVRRWVMQGADGCLVAGDSFVSSMRREAGTDVVVASYPFSSLTEERAMRLSAMKAERDERSILVVGQYLPYKGIDVALDALALLPRSFRIRIVGAGKRSGDVEAYARAKGVCHLEVVPFLSSDDLAREYLRAGLFVLPSRQECWGLVVNEAAICGCPLVSTWGSGAAVEVLSRDYPQLLAEPGSPSSLYRAMCTWFQMPPADRRSYSEFLRVKASRHTIESTVEAHLRLFDRVYGRLDV